MECGGSVAWLMHQSKDEPEPSLAPVGRIGADVEFEGPDNQFARLHPLQILIADDNYINRRVLLLLLQRFGYNADSVENGHDCINAALNKPYDLLLVDINMPDTSGIECAEQIRRAGRDLSIVAVTATSPEASRQQSFDAGMNGYLTKPVRLPELKATLREASLRREAKNSSQRLSADTVRLPKAESANHGHGDPALGTRSALRFRRSRRLPGALSRCGNTRPARTGRGRRAGRWRDSRP